MDAREPRKVNIRFIVPSRTMKKCQKAAEEVSSLGSFKIMQKNVMLLVVPLDKGAYEVGSLISAPVRDFAGPCRRISRGKLPQFAARDRACCICRSPQDFRGFLGR